MDIPQLRISFRLKITDILKDGFIGVDPHSKKLFKQKCFIQDRYSLKGDLFKLGDEVRIIITVVKEGDIKPDIENKEFYCIINELTSNGFYTKTYDINESKFKRVFFYDARGLITLPSEDFERFEVGDVLRIQIR